MIKIICISRFGKWMDGWESRRKRTAGHDWALIELGLPGSIDGFLVDTRFFTGNQAPRCSIQAANLSNKPLDLNKVSSLLSSRNTKKTWIGSACSEENLIVAESIHSEEWFNLVEMSTLLMNFGLHVL